MDDAKRRRLEADGWRVGDAEEFLELAPEEVALNEAQKAELDRRLADLERDSTPSELRSGEETQLSTLDKDYAAGLLENCDPPCLSLY